ncbi:hypothetical protein ASE86_10210 [Sphingomonas sp. Leaf33]|uniref:sterol desaturase family protein n=1 Tax=Sphingomonas sp. Leaf33 TaxID=1736215 RepID=UPI0007019874|nr:sterol desaturase family protein [Sphingomonas sp. Leaf33]KQN26469.1 hypothetical protein ASE86_10210 [Sphingomonas sp. Leaf33]
MTLLASVIESATATAIVWTFGFAVVTAVEIALPRERHSLGGRGAGLVFWAIWLAFSAVVYAAFRAMWSRLGIPPLVTLPTGLHWAGVASIIAAPILGAVVYDFFFYWCHRIQHRWLWKYHAVHHSIRELSSVNAYHHISEPVVQMLLITVPMSLIAQDAGPAVPAMMALLHLHLMFIHAPTRAHLGPLGRWVVDNRFHRIHHSLDTRHFDRNFGAFTTVWDRVFGTAWMPERGEWPATGIAEVDQPRTLRDWVMLPADYDAAVAQGRGTPVAETNVPARA